MNCQDVKDIPIPEMVAWNLIVESNVRKIYSSIKSIPTENSKRIKLVMEKLLSGKDLGDEFPATERSGNNSDIGAAHKRNGDERYKCNDKLTAMIHYTQAISYAGKNSALLAGSLNARSKCLYELGMFRSSIQDMQRVVLDNLPINLKSDLFFRKSMCHRAIACQLLIPMLENPEGLSEMHRTKFNQIIEDYNKLKAVPYNKANEVQYKPSHPTSFRDNFHSLIPGFSNVLDLNYTKQDGRYITASRDIKPGELIGICKPYVSVVKFSDRFNFCWHCTKQVWNGVPCEWCTVTIYCSEKCREASFKSFHDVECFVLPRLSASGIDQDKLMTLRAIIKAYKECDSRIDKLMSTYNINDKTPSKDEMYKSKYQPDKFSSFHNSWSKFQPDLHDINSQIFAKSFTVAYLFAIGIGLVHVDATLSSLKNHDKFLYLFGLVERSMRIVKFNQFHHEINSKYLNKDVITSSTVNPSFSLFNHECLNNVIRIRKGDHEFLYSIAPIKEGAQLYSNYYKNDFSNATTKDRKNYLLSTFGIDCKCMACADDWILKNDVITNDNSMYLKDIKQGLEKSGKQIQVLRNLASDYFCKNNDLNDVSSYIEKGVEIVEACYEHLQLDSADLVNSRLHLSQLIQLTQEPLVYPKD